MKTIIQCPECGFKKEEVIPKNFCLYFYECTNCRKNVKTKGD